MRAFLHNARQQFVDRWFWIQQVVVTALASAISWQVGDGILKNGGVVAAIVAALTVRSSLHKSTREGLGQILGSSVGAGAALLALHFFGLGLVTVGLTVLISLRSALLRTWPCHSWSHSSDLASSGSYIALGRSSCDQRASHGSDRDWARAKSDQRIESPHLNDHWRSNRDCRFGICSPQNSCR